jgi:argininosuccinate lyase
VLYRDWKAEEAVKYTSSIAWDKEILDQVKLVLKAHVIELYLSGYVSRETAAKLVRAIGSFREIPENYEDVHEAIEDYLLKVVGEEAGWVGFARSRNDHVATALRLKARDMLVDLLDDLLDLRSRLLERAEREKETLFPVYTHFQPAQPSTFGHYLSYVEEELASRWSLGLATLKNLNRSPLGSGAIVGTNAKIDRAREARMLGFSEPIYNTIQATGSRAELIDVAYFAASLMLVHSRVAEDLILLSSKFVDFVELPDSHVSTSSLMPQKRNAVTMEVLRSRTGLCIGRLTGAMASYKSLPSGYNLDLQEINPTYFECLREASLATWIIGSALLNLKVKAKGLDPETLATDEAELLALKGEPYRKAYKRIAQSLRAGLFSPSISFNQSIEMKAVLGSPSPSGLGKALELQRSRLETDKQALESLKSSINEGLASLRVVEDDLLQEGD